MIVRAPWWLRAMTPTAVFRLTDVRRADRIGMPAIRTSLGRIFLTFDDGPIPEVTPWVLDVLDRFGVKATFFMVGENAERYPYLVEEVRRRGHFTANHAHRHRPGLKSSTLTYLEDVRLAHKAIHTDNTDETDITVSRVFRPPHGYIRPLQLLALRLEGYEVVLFDVVSRDFDAALRPEEVRENVLENVRDGSVIVFHDSLKAFPRLEKALPEVLEILLNEKSEYIGL